MHNRQGLTLKLLWSALMDYDLWPMYAISFTMLIPTNPVTAYLTLTLKNVGFDTFQTNLLTIPGYVLFLIQLIFWSWVSEKINNRIAIVWYYCLWCLPLLLALELLPATASSWSWYAVTILVIGFPYIHSIMGMLLQIPFSFSMPDISYSNIIRSLVALMSRNAGSVRTRTVGSAVYNMICQASSIISSNVSILSGPYLPHLISNLIPYNRSTAQMMRPIIEGATKYYLLSWPGTLCFQFSSNASISGGTSLESASGMP